VGLATGLRPRATSRPRHSTVRTWRPSCGCSPMQKCQSPPGSLWRLPGFHRRRGSPSTSRSDHLMATHDAGCSHDCSRRALRPGRAPNPTRSSAGEPTGEPNRSARLRTGPYRCGRCTSCDLHSERLARTRTDARECFASRGSEGYPRAQNAHGASNERERPVHRRSPPGSHR
jgi:hypothetical protein